MVEFTTELMGGMLDGYNTKLVTDHKNIPKLLWNSFCLHLNRVCLLLFILWFFRRSVPRRPPPLQPPALAGKRRQPRGRHQRSLGHFDLAFPCLLYFFLPASSGLCLTHRPHSLPRLSICFPLSSIALLLFCLALLFIIDKGYTLILL